MLLASPAFAIAIWGHPSPQPSPSLPPVPTPVDSAKFVLDSGSIPFSPVGFSTYIDDKNFALPNYSISLNECGRMAKHLFPHKSSDTCGDGNLSILYMNGRPEPNKRYRLGKSSSMNFVGGMQRTYFGSLCFHHPTKTTAPCMQIYYEGMPNAKEAQITYLSVPGKVGDKVSVVFKILFAKGNILKGAFNAPVDQGPPAAVAIPLKPVIYLYPPATEKVKVELDYRGGLQTTYPAYDPAIKGWEVTAHPDGTLETGGKEYSYLFWDGKRYDFSIDMKEGFVIKGSDTAKFFQETLKKLGLTAKEYNEFIVYWLPKMQSNPYNFIHFAGKGYTDAAQLTITPRPDSLLRVFMVYEPLQKPIRVKPQRLSSFHRHGFTVVEWGGSEITH